MTRLAAFALVAVTACHPAKPTTMPWPALDAKLLADSAATFNFRLGLPTLVAITKDGAVLFRRTAAREFAADLYELDTKTGAVKTLVTAADLLGTGDEHLSDAEKARRERSRTATRGVVDADVSEDGKIVMVPLGGKLYLVDRTTGARHAIDPGGEAYDPHLSPDGAKIAFVRDGDLYVVTTGSAPRRLTHHPDGFEYGVAEFVAQEELDRRRGFWWSPDSSQLLFQRSDLRPVETIYVADARHPEHAPVPFKYPRAGTPNAIVDLGVVAASGGDAKWITWDVAQYPYLVNLAWRPHAPATALVMNRDQTDVAVLRLDATAATATTLFTEHDDAWINTVAGGPAWLLDGSGLLWMTEASGAWTLELRAPDGKLVRALTQAELGLRALIGVEDKAAIVTAGIDPTKQDVLRIPFDGSAPQRISSGDGFAMGAANHDVTVIAERSHAGGHRSYAVAQSARYELPSVAERPSLVPTTAIETVEVGGRTQYAAVTRPRTFDRHHRYPVLLKVYAGPHTTTVFDALDDYVMDQWYADAGFIVVRTDGRGTPFRGRAWERAILKDLITVAMDDQVAGLRAIGARHPEMDLGRVGVAGWSFGGYFSAMAVLLHPELFKAAVAGAPVTDWALYDSAYTERYMKTPDRNADGYAKASVLTHAASLTRPLLVIHGITDDNVHFANTLALIEALYVAGKRAEVITLSSTHMVPDPKLNLAREQVQIDFFRQHLGPP